MDFLNSYKADISRLLIRFLAKKKADFSSVNTFGPDVTRRIRSTIDSGKFIRGTLVPFSYEAFGGRTLLDAQRIGAALELIHTGFLIHDDIMDRDMVRRGEPTLWKQYDTLAKENAWHDPGHTGESLAIAAGDALFFAAAELLGTVETIPKELFAILMREYASVCIAQMQDVSFGASDDAPDKDEIRSMYRYKTARYTFSMPLVSGAMLAGASDRTVELLTTLGEALGMIFQIRDDWLGLYGATAKTGKSVGTDIREGKKTLAAWYLFEEIRDVDRKRIKRIFGNSKATDYQIGQFRNILSMYDVEKRLSEEIKTHERTASSCITKLPVSAEKKAHLRELLAFVSTRKS